MSVAFFCTFVSNNDKMEKYELTKDDKFLKNGHTMFLGDVLTDLKRKAFLEEEIIRLREKIKEIDNTNYY